jgi:hypothetical protein
MGYTKDITGQKRGKLTAVKLVGRKQRPTSKRTDAIWRFKCDCGRTCEMTNAVFRRLQAPNCGCTKTTGRPKGLTGKPKKYPDGHALRNNVVYSYKRQASQRGLDFELTDEQCHILFEQSCHYCGNEPSNKRSHPSYNGPFKYNGIDRVDNNVGYKKENCVSCCKFCNLMKRVLSKKDFLNHVAQIYHFQQEK